MRGCIHPGVIGRVSYAECSPKAVLRVCVIAEGGRGSRNTAQPCLPSLIFVFLYEWLYLFVVITL